MYSNGHTGASLLVYAPIGGVALANGFDRLAIVGGVIAVGLAMVPDYDQKVPGISHRGVTHTVYFAVLIGAIAAGIGYLGGQNLEGVGPVLAGGFAGVVATGTILSHILADMLTPMGVDPFLTGNRRSFDLVNASNTIANYVLLFLGVAAAGAAAALGTGVAQF
jgi:inner membrane protein